MRHAKQWSVATTGVMYNRVRLECNIRRYRQQMRRALYAIIRELERDIDRTAGDYLPLKVPDKGSAMYDYGPPLRRATNRTSYTIRSWAGDKVVAHRRFWGQRDAGGCGLDELFGVNGLGYWQEAAPEEGHADAYERFVGLVACNRELRGRGGFYGMITWGLASHIARLLGDEWPLSEMLLVGTIEDAVTAVAKELSSLVSRYEPGELTEDEADDLRSRYLMMEVANAPDEAFLSLLTEGDQALIQMTGAIYANTWREVAARKLGVCENIQLDHEMEVVGGLEYRAPVIPLPRRRGRRLARAAGI
jgi:hypothetical protein